MGENNLGFQLIRCFDPAIQDDTGGLTMGRYAMDRDMKHLTFREGEQPVVFHCRPLTLSQRRNVTIVGDQNMAEQHRRAFAYGLVRVEGYDGPGTVFEARQSDGKMMLDADLDKFAEDDVQEIGSVIRARSFLGRGIPLRLLALPSSLDACRSLLSLRAEQTNG